MPCRRGGSDGLGDHVGCRLGEGGEDPARVEPAHPKGAEEVLPVDVPGSQLRRRGVPAVGNPEGSSHAEAALGEVESVSDVAAAAVGGNPANLRRVDASLQDEVLEQPADVVVDERGDDRCALAEAPAQPARDVVFAAAFPHLELARSTDPSHSRVEAEHDLAERDEVVRTVARRPDLELAHRLSCRTEKNSLARQPRNGCKVTGSDQRRSHHPTAADRRHRRQLEVRRGIRCAHAAGRDPANAGERPVQRTEKGYAADRLGREELEEIETLVECRDDLGRRRHTGNHEDAQLSAALDDAGAETGRDDEPGAGLDRQIDLLRPHDGAGTDEESRLGGEEPDRVRGSRRSEGDFGDRQPTLGECLRQRPHGFDLLDHHDRDDPATQDRVADLASVHRASHPPSTGRMTPCT